MAFLAAGTRPGSRLTPPLLSPDLGQCMGTEQPPGPRAGLAEVLLAAARVHPGGLRRGRGVHLEGFVEQRRLDRHRARADVDHRRRVRQAASRLRAVRDRGARQLCRGGAAPRPCRVRRRRPWSAWPWAGGARPPGRSVPGRAPSPGWRGRRPAIRGSSAECCSARSSSLPLAIIPFRKRATSTGIAAAGRLRRIQRATSQRPASMPGVLQGSCERPIDNRESANISPHFLIKIRRTHLSPESRQPHCIGLSNRRARKPLQVRRPPPPPVE